MRKFIVGCLLLLLVLLGYQQYRLSRTRKEPNQGSQRFISLSPTLTEILFELGAGKDLVAVTTYCVYPEEAKAKEKIGDFVNPNFEKIVSSPTSSLQKPGLPARLLHVCGTRGSKSQRSRALAPLKRSTRRSCRSEKVSVSKVRRMQLLKA